VLLAITVVIATLHGCSSNVRYDVCQSLQYVRTYKRRCI